MAQLTFKTEAIFLGQFRGADVAEDEDDSGNLLFVVSDWRRAIVNGNLSAVLRYQERTFRQVHHNSFS